MITRQIPNLSFSQICQSGQCFRMTECRPGVYEVIAGDRRLEVSQQQETCVFDCSQRDFDEFWSGYFDLERDYGAYIDQINPRDSYLLQAAACGSGIRILKQDLWEMIVTFLISQQNNIVRIRRCIDNICREYGCSITDEKGHAYYAFPRPEALAELPEDALMACNLGYRSKYVVRAAKAVVSGAFDLHAVEQMNYRQSREALLTLFGAGEKVADCICLFALHHLEAFPIDTHIRQALDQHYKRGFPNRRYQGHQGILQQYIFYYESAVKRPDRQRACTRGCQDI
ncbi:MAG: DNA glycosylase [Eubacteriales bacterium]|nr:DNA glycosylase [Eubacteriales bacterium]